jgi:mRNA interferase MazF
MIRGEIWWAALAAPAGSAPGFRRPVLIVQSDAFTRSAIRTVIVAAITSNVALAEAPGNVRVGRRGTGLRTESVVNVSQVVTADKASLTKRLGAVSPHTLNAVDAGLRLVLGLGQ